MLENIKKMCRSRGISLAELERSCGFGKKSIYAWAENSPSIDRVKLVADYFGVTVDDLLSPAGAEQDSA